MIVYVLKFPFFLLLHIIHLLSYLFPRNRRIWIFDSWRGKRFADNSKYFFLYINSDLDLRKYGIRTIWLTESDEVLKKLSDAGYEVYKLNSFWGWFFTLRAGLLFSDFHPFSINYWLSGGLRRINLWHGLPLKKILYDSIATKKDNWLYNSKGLKRFGHFFFSPGHFVLGDYVLTADKFWLKIYASSFRKNEDKIIISGVPRNDVLISKIKGSEIGTDADALLKMRQNYERGIKNVLYVPTFRDRKEGVPFLEDLNFNGLFSFLSQERVHLFAKFHHGAKGGVMKNENVTWVKSEADPYPLFQYTDVMITDYSSIYMDFLSTEKPIVFFAYDLQDYLSNKREMYFDYNEFTPGEKAFSVEELKDVLEKVCSGKDDFYMKRKDFSNKIFKSYKELSCPKLFSYIVNKFL